MNAIIPIAKRDIAIRPATMSDLPQLDALQKKHSRALGYFPTKQFEGYIEMGAVLVAEEPSLQPSPHPSPGAGSPTAMNRGWEPLPGEGVRVGYIIARDRYLKRDELGVIYQLCVTPEAQRSLVGATLVKEVFARSAYGCRLYCCWCAQDLEANYFWESLGFVSIAFRAGSTGKKRVHIFWQKRIVEGDAETKWWYPSQTNSGAIREDRLVFPIPPGTHWSEVKAVAIARVEKPALEDAAKKSPKTSRASHAKKLKGPITTARTGLRFGAPPKAGESDKSLEKDAAKRAPRAKVKIDPKLVRAARELRDRYLERINDEPSLLGSHAKYDLTRMLEAAPAKAALTPTLPKPLPQAA